MTREEIVVKVTSAIDAAMKTRMYGELQVEFRAGEATFMRTLREEKLDETENRHHGRKF